MSITKAKFFEALGLWPKRPEPIVKNDPGRDPGELAEAAARTMEALRQPAPQAQPGRPLVGLTTDDVDSRTGRLYPDYLEAREKRETERRARAESAPAAIIDHDIKPI